MNYYNPLIIELNLLREQKSSYSVDEYVLKLSIIREKLMLIFVEMPLTLKEEQNYSELLELM